MAVSKTLRYQVLRRDNFTCRYCGGVAPNVVLTVDHVLAVTLGGSDDSSNLVASCRDCNAGKAASTVDQPLIDQVSADAVRWAKAVEFASAQALDRHREDLTERDMFDSTWRTFSYRDRTGVHEVPRPLGWEDSVDHMRARGLPTEILQECVRIAMERPHIKLEGRFNYFCGIAWKKIRTIDDGAISLYSGEQSTSPKRTPICGETDCEADAFPDMELMGYFSERLVHLMGGSPVDQWFASRVLWDGLSRASFSWDSEMASPGCCCTKAMDAAREAIDDSIARHLQKMADVGKDPDSVYYMGASPREPVISIGRAAGDDVL